MNPFQLYKLWHKVYDLDKVTASKWQNQDSKLVDRAPESTLLSAM